jgi:hypothetical protein
MAENEPFLHYPWQRSYFEAMIEWDGPRLEEKIRYAETEIYSRLTQLTDAPQDEEEQQAARNALAGLAALKRRAAFL